MCRFLLISIFTLLISINCYSQEKNVNDEYQISFKNLSNKNIQFKLNYLKQKETLLFELSNNNILLESYQIRIKDIHPEGIFINKSEGNKTLRILSIKNRDIFIKNSFKNGYRVSNTTNYIDIGGIENFDDGKLLRFINEFKEFIVLKNNTKQHNDVDIKIDK